MTAREIAQAYNSILRGETTVRRMLKHNEVVLGRVVPAARATVQTAIKRNKRRLKSIMAAKRFIESFLEEMSCNLSRAEVRGVWPSFLTFDGRCRPPWAVADEADVRSGGGHLPRETESPTEWANPRRRQ